MPRFRLKTHEVVAEQFKGPAWVENFEGAIPPPPQPGISWELRHAYGLSTSKAWFPRLDSAIDGRDFVHPGDWIVCINGIYVVMHDLAFQESYEPIE